MTAKEFDYIIKCEHLELVALHSVCSWRLFSEDFALCVPILVFRFKMGPCHDSRFAFVLFEVEILSFISFVSPPLKMPLLSFSELSVLH